VNPLEIARDLKGAMCINPKMNPRKKCSTQDAKINKLGFYFIPKCWSKIESNSITMQIAKHDFVFYQTL
jgi:hypothetical protein